MSAQSTRSEGRLASAHPAGQSRAARCSSVMRIRMLGLSSSGAVPRNQIPDPTVSRAGQHCAQSTEACKFEKLSPIHDNYPRLRLWRPASFTNGITDLLAT